MADAGGDHEAIDVEALERNLQRKLSGKLVMSPRCSIFKIPTILSRHNKNAYTPNAFSFGPFHYNNDQLRPTEKIKAKYLLDLMSRVSNPNCSISPNSNPNCPVSPNSNPNCPVSPNSNPNCQISPNSNPNPNCPLISPNSNDISPDIVSMLIKKFTKSIRKVQKEAREYYAGEIGIQAEKFVEILVLDGCFIIELFRKKSYSNLRDKCDPIFTMSCLLQFLYHDLILLENQIPWMVLEILFNKTITSIDKKPLVELAIDFFGNIFSTKPTPTQPLLSVNQNHGSKHILDLLRNSLVLNSSVTKQRSYQWEPMLSATNLQDSGITFKVNFHSDSILDIQFCKKTGVMVIPTLLIQETTETVFRNLISLEQCCPNYEPIVTSYAVLLDNLINTNADIQILCKSKTIVNWMNMDDATRFFNRLYIDTFVKENYYLRLTNEVNEYCGRSWHRHRRVLVRDYFNHPWALISVIAASTALILTFLQTVFGIIKG